MSMWSVDETTAKLMKLFYQNIKSGLSKSTALRQAKRKLLRSRERGMSFAHPFL
ncbi:MAG: CHAT domain-containing protein [bacterium]